MALKALIVMALAAAPASCAMNGDRDEDGVLDEISPTALAALPEGTDPGFLVRDPDGCYAVIIEVTEPQTGIPLRDAAGQHICDA